jgi:hypothetical protein
VAVTYLGWQQPKRFYEQVTSSPHLSKIVSSRSRSAIHAKSSHGKMRAHPAPMFPVITVGPFTKWGIDYTTCNPPSARGHRYIIVAVDYFTKWVEAMPTFKDDGETANLFLFNQIIARFGVPREIVTDHGSHFQNQMMSELTSKLGLRQEHFITLLSPSQWAGGSC